LEKELAKVFEDENNLDVHEEFVNALEVIINVEGLIDSGLFPFKILHQEESTIL